MFLRYIKKSYLIFIVVVYSIQPVFSQVSESDTRYIRIGELQSHFSAYGSERAWNNSFYEGLQWPADYSLSDNSVIRRAWYAIQDYTDAEGEHWDFWANYLYKGYAQLSIYPMQLEQIAKFEPPTVYVDGDNITAPYAGDVDRIDPNQIADRIVINKINTSSGVTITRKIYAFSQQYHDNYFIKEFVFKNTGNIDDDAEIELNAPIKGLRFGWGTRYSVSREGASFTDNQQSWGKHSWVTRRGEDYAAHENDVINFTENTPREELDWIPGTFSWLGQSEVVDYDMIGAPNIKGNGRLASPQFAGIGVLHADKSATDNTNDPEKIVNVGWHAGDSFPGLGDLRKTDMVNMGLVYNMLSGTPYPSPDYGGTNRMFEDNTTSITDPVDPYKIHGDGGGTNVWLTYGPYDLAPGDSVVVVEVEGISGINRTLCEEIGERWLAAHRNSSDKGPFDLPDGTTTDNKDIYKNSWIYTGMDSIMSTFSRATRNYNMGMLIPQPPLPPTVFEINSGGDKIMLNWAKSPSEDAKDFAGYRIYRAIGKPDTTYDMIAEVAPGVLTYDDKSAIRGQSYYYYLTAYDDGSNNESGIANPTGSLESGRFYTKTNKAAYLRRKAGDDFSDIRIVPNPYNIKNRDYQYIGNPDRLMFLDIPPYCDIKIFTERGDLIKTIKHTDGSGDQAWNSVSSSRQVVVSGIYIAHFEVTQDIKDPVTGDYIFKKGQSALKKFVIIR